MSPLLLEDRYELLDEVPHTTAGRLYRARDVAFGEIVGVRQLGPNSGLDEVQRPKVESTVRRLQSLRLPHLARIYRFDATLGFLVKEWLPGVSLLDLLRRRREIGLMEAVRLLSPLPAMLDALAREAVPIPRPLLRKLYAELADGSAPDAVVTTPLDRWPTLRLKLNPLSLRSAPSGPTTEEAAQTVVFSPRQTAEIMEMSGPREFALLLFELLGGRIREVDNGRYIPIGALREAGNAVLKRELLAEPYPDCDSLWQALLQSQSDSVRVRRETEAEPPVVRTKYRIPGESLTSAHAGVTLKLEAVDPAMMSIHLTARPRFTIGRSVAMADFVARVLPENEINDARTNRLSRIHAVFEIEQGQITLRDGNGTAPSLNGSSLDGQPLPPNRPAVILQRARLVLGDEYAVDVVPIESVEPADWEITNLEDWHGPAENLPLTPFAALACEPAEGHGLSRQIAWIFSQIGFGLDAAGRIIWDTRALGASPAAFHYHRGCFWLRNHSFPMPVFIGRDTALAPGEIAPLVPGQTIRIGHHDFAVQVE